MYICEQMKEDLIQIALDRLKEVSTLTGVYSPKGPLDGKLNLWLGEEDIESTILIVTNLRQHQWPVIAELASQYENLILVGERLSVNAKAKLRAQGFAYLEANGNIYLSRGHCFLYIDSNKPYKAQKSKGNRAFTKTGLKVLMQLLIEPELINRTHREIASRAKVALGNIPQVIDGLKQSGFLLPLNKKEYLWENRQDLVQKWVNEYATILRPKTIKGRYKVPEEWRELKFQTEASVWGGEPAADIITNHLRPEVFLIHTSESLKELSKNYRLIPAENGKLEVLDKFWLEPKGLKTAPPILVYAELLISGGKRNEETAELIYNEFIKPDL